jgi:hypothetical protein
MVLPGGALRVVAGCWVASRRGRPDIRLPAGRSETPVSITPNKTQNRMAQRIHEPTYPFASGSRTADGKSMFLLCGNPQNFLAGGVVADKSEFFPGQ